MLSPSWIFSLFETFSHFPVIVIGRGQFDWTVRPHLIYVVSATRVNPPMSCPGRANFSGPKGGGPWSSKIFAVEPGAPMILMPGALNI